jgi:DNA repair exonuclease SbcCD ATPase subunit
MSEQLETNATPEQPATPNPSSDGTENTGGSVQTIPYDRFKQVNDQKKELQARLDALEKAEQARQQAEMEKQGQYQELIETLKPEAERAKQLQAQLEAYQQRDQQELDAELDALDKDMQELLPDGSPSEQLAWLRTAKRKGLFNKPTPPPTDAGTQGDPKQPEKELPAAQQSLYDLAKQRQYLRRRGNS